MYGGRFGNEMGKLEVSYTKTATLTNLFSRSGVQTFSTTEWKEVNINFDVEQGDVHAVCYTLFFILKNRNLIYHSVGVYLICY